MKPALLSMAVVSGPHERRVRGKIGRARGGDRIRTHIVILLDARSSKVKAFS